MSEQTVAWVLAVIVLPAIRGLTAGLVVGLIIAFTVLGVRYDRDNQ